MKIKSLFLAFVVGAMVTSCSTSRSNLTYFEDIDSSYQVNVNTTDYSPKITVDDELYIMVTSTINPGASAVYNLPLTNQATRDALAQSTTPRVQTYIVGSDGTIDMPVLGKIKVEGLTVDQLKTKVAELVGRDVEDPLVVARMMNFKVNVAGEVKNPGPQVVTSERYSVLDALTAAGDLTEYGERTNVLIVREENGKREAHRLNLNSSDVLTSPYFYLKQNDYVYVTPNQIRSDNSKYNQNNAFKLSVISTIVSGCSVVASLIIALAIK
jgi:polysaccharide export outer membrane protein